MIYEVVIAALVQIVKACFVLSVVMIGLCVVIWGLYGLLRLVAPEDKEEMPDCAPGEIGWWL